MSGGERGPGAQNGAVCVGRGVLLKTTATVPLVQVCPIQLSTLSVTRPSPSPFSSVCHTGPLSTLSLSRSVCREKGRQAEKAESKRIDRRKWATTNSSVAMRHFPSNTAIPMYGHYSSLLFFLPLSALSPFWLSGPLIGQHPAASRHYRPSSAADAYVTPCIPRCRYKWGHISLFSEGADWQRRAGSPARAARQASGPEAEADGANST